MNDRTAIFCPECDYIYQEEWETKSGSLPVIRRSCSSNHIWDEPIQNPVWDGSKYG